jgi:hypothetical protein
VYDYSYNHSHFNYIIIHLRGVTKDGGTIRDKQEIDSGGDNNKLTRNGNTIVNLSNNGTGILDVELTGTRNIHMTRRLVVTGVDVEGNEETSLILRGTDVGSTIGVGSILMEEVAGKFVVKRDTMSTDSKTINGFGVDGGGSGGCDIYSSGGEWSGTSSRLISGGECGISSGKVGESELLVLNTSELMPVGKVVLLGLGTETNEHRLNRPLKTLEMDIAIGGRD